MPLPADYTERVYAGVLGKIIGVYLGRPFEGWTYERITEHLGEIQYYVNEKLGQPLVVADDDISGTFTFLRALPDYDNTPDLTPEQIGQTWLNYLIEKRTVLWWGGMGNSTEHTAYLRLKHGIPAPQSGSIELNSKVVAEQIGAQIFIDGWGMIAPGDPERAADFARRAASVSHDGEAIYGAQVVAAMEAQAFVETDINKLIDTALACIPRDCLIARLIHDLREWHSAEKDWRKTREKIVAQYGYDKYGGNCHMIPNHALIIHALLHGEGDFQKSLTIVNTCGWDTDCNSGNVGCLMGIRGGLEGIDNGPDWRGPIADRLYLPTADGGRCITDAVQETYRIVNIGRSLAGESRLAPKDGARFHFSLPGSFQGFHLEDSPECRSQAHIYHDAYTDSEYDVTCLVTTGRNLAQGIAYRIATPTFLRPEEAAMPGYGVLASPTLYSGQIVRASLAMDESNTRPITVCLYVRVYNQEDKLEHRFGPKTLLAPSGEGNEDWPTPALDWHTLEWQVPDTGGQPIAEIGVQFTSEERADMTAYLEWLTWDGTPNVEFNKPAGGTLWRRAWVNGVDHFEGGWDKAEPYRLIQDEGTGLAIQGTREWTDYQVSAQVTPHLIRSAGLAARVQGMRRYYALLLQTGGKVALVKALDGTRVLAQADFNWQYSVSYAMTLTVRGNQVEAEINGKPLFNLRDDERPLTGGAIALLCEEGRVGMADVRVQPAE